MINLLNTEEQKSTKGKFVKGSDLEVEGEVIEIGEVKTHKAYRKEGDERPEGFEIMLVEVDYDDGEEQRLITLGEPKPDGNQHSKQKSFVKAILELGWVAPSDATETEDLLISINDFIGDGLRLLFRPTEARGEYKPSIKILPPKPPKEKKRRVIQ